jgi:hypothetical protein
MTHRPCLLVSRAGMAGRPRAKKRSLYQESFSLTLGIKSARKKITQNGADQSITFPPRHAPRRRACTPRGIHNFFLINPAAA